MGMLEEILGSAPAWRQALDLSARNALPYEATLFVGSGSSYYLAQVAAHMAREKGQRSWALPSAEAMLTPRVAKDFKKVVAFSRSGETTELLQAVEALALPAWLITTKKQGPKRELFEKVVVLDLAVEEAIVQTRSFSSALVYVLKALSENGALDSLPRRFQEEIPDPSAPIAEFPRGKRYFFLGMGPAWGVAQEAALKMTETALVEAQAFQSLEFRHGPKSRVDEDTVVILFASHPLEKPLGEELRGLNARVLELGGNIWELPISLARIQLFAHRLAREQGLDPDHPRHLTYAVRL